MDAEEVADHDWREVGDRLRRGRVAGADARQAARARGGTPDREQRLLKQIRRLKELRAADEEEIAQLKADVEALVGALHQTKGENQLLRQQLTERAAVLRTLPAQPRPRPGQPERGNS
ncbi:hypothetical protein AB0L10_45570 [Streptomyces flaveolus]|uniref:hypothetical protein n=1 Tax=Streptomyces flaveolus TaxID=67297 RepID=UPI003442AF7A